MLQGFKNALNTLDRMVTQRICPLHDFPQSYFDDILVHNRAEHQLSAMKVHINT